MLVIQTRQQLEEYLKEQRKADKTIGLVPTMGALHDGHMELVKNCLKTCEITLVSIFVNPAQFNDLTDFEAYPKAIDNDLELLKIRGVDVVFTPTVQEMYGDSVRLEINFGELQSSMEGAHRKGHFEGVGLVVAKLFNLTKPDVAFFGEKDFQQLAIIRELNKTLSFNIEIVGVPIVREPSGLAMSSRNELLSDEGRKQAAELYRSLTIAENMLRAGDDINTTKSNIGALFEADPNIELEYFEIADQDSLQPIKEMFALENGRLFIAAYIEEVRLIDNIPFNLRN